MESKQAETGEICDNPIKLEKISLSVLCFRWAVVALVSVLPFIQPGEKGAAALQSAAAAIAYNIIVTVYLLNRGKNYKKVLTAIAFADILLSALLTFHLGGIDSDTYILFFFIIGACCVGGDYSNVLHTGMFAIALYTISCLCAAGEGQHPPDAVRLIVKDLFLVLGISGTFFVSREVRRYNELHKKEFRLARMDRLTGLANRHYFDHKIKEEAAYSDHTGNPLNILMLDLDNFKKFNDTYGHTLGDKLLVLFADIIKNNIRKTDIPVRYGGEEFLILIRDLDIVIAKSVGERIRRQLEKQHIYIETEEGRQKVTVSCGIAQYPAHSRDLREAIEYADRALYHAKGTGKNTVVTYDEITGFHAGEAGE